MHYGGLNLVRRSENPRFFGELPCCSHYAKGDNPFCGDSIQLYLKVIEHENDTIIGQASFTGYACSLCVASTDLLLEHIIGMRTQQALAFELKDLLKLLGGVEVGRIRKGCVELPLKIFDQALRQT